MVVPETGELKQPNGCPVLFRGIRRKTLKIPGHDPSFAGLVSFIPQQKVSARRAFADDASTGRAARQITPLRMSTGTTGEWKHPTSLNGT
jgi:hypothetical protein